jgi:hypothetical protein
MSDPRSNPLKTFMIMSNFLLLMTKHQVRAILTKAPRNKMIQIAEGNAELTEFNLSLLSLISVFNCLKTSAKSILSFSLFGS